MAVGTVIIAVAAAGVARARHQITLPRTLLATIAALLTLPLAVLVTVAVWAAELALPSIGLFPDVFAVLPAALAALVAGLWAADRPVVRTVVHTVGVLPAAVLLGPAVLDAFDVGLGEGGLLAALFLALLVLLTLAPVDAPAHASAKRARGAAGLVRRLRVPLILLLVVALGFGAGLLLNREGPTDPRQAMITYSLDADTGEAVWSSRSPSGSAWARELMADPRDSLSHLPWLDGGETWRPAPPRAPRSRPRSFK